MRSCCGIKEELKRKLPQLSNNVRKPKIIAAMRASGQQKLSMEDV